MDPEAFLDLANQVTKLKMYPYFDLAHAALCCLAVRDDLANGNNQSESLFTFNEPIRAFVFVCLLVSTNRNLCLLFVYIPLTNHNAGSLPFSRKHPLSLWVSSMLVVFSGGILANLLLGEPVLAPLKNNNQLLLSTIVW